MSALQPPADPAPRRTRLTAAGRRETILRAAAEVFAETGYRAAKVSDIAARVGVTDPVIFQNFGTKSALYAAVIAQAADGVRAHLDQLTAIPGGAATLLAHILSGPAHPVPGPASTGPAHQPPAPAPPAGSPGHCDPGRAGPDHPAAAYGPLFAGAAALLTDPDLPPPARDLLHELAAHLTDLIRRGQADGSLQPGTDPQAAAWLLLSVLSARPLRTAAMPAHLEPALAALTLRTLAAPQPGRPHG